jgi:hypothetical protein
MDASKIRFDRHAKRRMRWRRISEEEVSLAIESPDRIEESIRGRTNVYKLTGERYIKVTYKEFSGQILVISAVDKGKGG